MKRIILPLLALLALGTGRAIAQQHNPFEGGKLPLIPYPADVRVGERDFDPGMRRAEDGQHFRQKEHLSVFRRTDHDASVLAPVDVFHRAAAVLADFRDALFRFEEDPARFRERQRTRGAVEDFGAQVLFDSLHELRERGLRDAERLGGFGDAAGRKDGGEVAVGLGVHGLGML